MRLVRTLSLLIALAGASTVHAQEVDDNESWVGTEPQVRGRKCPDVTKDNCLFIDEVSRHCPRTCRGRNDGSAPDPQPYDHPIPTGGSKKKKTGLFNYTPVSMSMLPAGWECVPDKETCTSDDCPKTCGPIKARPDPKTSSTPACGTEIQLKSWKGDYLQRPDGAPGLTTSSTAAGTTWSVECKEGKVLLKSRKGDYLSRPNRPSGVTTALTGAGNQWTVESVGEKFRLKSSKGDYLHRPDAPQGVTSWAPATSPGNEWTAVRSAKTTTSAPPATSQPGTAKKAGN